MTTTTRRLLSFSTTALLVLALAQPAAAAPTGPWSSGGDLLARAWASLAELTSGSSAARSSGSRPRRG